MALAATSTTRHHSPLRDATEDEVEEAILAMVEAHPEELSPGELVQQLRGQPWEYRFILPDLLVRQVYWRLLDDEVIRIMQPAWKVRLVRRPSRQHTPTATAVE